MPNTKSAERRVRANERKRLQNRSVKSHLRKVEKGFTSELGSSSKEESAKSLQAVHSALDKAVKSGAIHRSTANRRKSRFSSRLAAAS